MIPPDEISCRNRFFPSQKWELAPQMIFWIGRASPTQVFRVFRGKKNYKRVNDLFY